MSFHSLGFDIPIHIGSGKEDKVDTPIDAYVKMSEKWKLPLTLRGGTLEMQRQCSWTLPKEPEEELPGYQIRVSRSILTNMYKDTLEKLREKPFSRDLTVHNLPEALKYLVKDVDGTGRSLNQFAKDLFDDVLFYGLTHVFTDFTRLAENETSRILTIAEERAAGARVLFQQIPPPAAIGWRQQQQRGSATSLSQIRIKEIRNEPSGQFLEEQVGYIRVINNDGSWELWRKGEEDNEYQRTGETGVLTLQKLPFTTIYGKRTGFMTGSPPLEDLAWVNLAHFRSDSDQRNILRFSRFAMLFGKGFDPDKKMAVGPTNIFLAEHTDSEMYYVEPKGSGLAAGDKDLTSLEQRAERLGAQPLAFGQGVKTATGANIDENRNLSPLQAMIKVTEEALVELFEYAAEWHKIKLPDNFAIDIFSDFRVSLYDDNGSNLLLDSTREKRLTTKTYLNELKRRGKLSEDVDIDAEIAELEKQLADEEAKENARLEAERARLLESQSVKDKEETSEKEAETVSDEL